MTRASFERDLRDVLNEMASLGAPRSLAASTATLGTQDRATGSRSRRLASAAFGTIAIVMVAVLTGSSYCGPVGAPPMAGAAGPKAFVWGTQMATLAADRLSMEAGGRTFEAPQDADYVISDPGSATYRTLELAWHDAGKEMRLNVYLGADAIRGG